MEDQLNIPKRAVTTYRSSVEDGVDKDRSSEKLKVFRSKSSIIPGLYEKSLISYEDKEVTGKNNREAGDIRGSEVGEPQVPQNLSGQVESLFNGTLVLTASPDQIQRNSTVIIRPGLLSGDSSLPETPNFENRRYQLDAVSPLTDVNTEIDTESPSSPKPYDLNHLTELVPTRMSALVPDLYPGSENSILDPLRGNSIRKTNSIFKEHSAVSVQDKLNAITRNSTEDLFPETGSCKNSIGLGDDEDIKPFTTDRSPEGTKDEVQRNVSNKRKWFSIVSNIILSLTCVVLIIMVIIFIRGTEDSTFNFLDRMDGQTRNNFIDSIMKKYEAPHLDNRSDNFTLGANNLYTFKGVAYSPLNSMEPLCGTTLEDVEQDMMVLSTITNKIRTYGMQCNQNKFILETIESKKLDLVLSMGVWISSNETVNKQQLDLMKELLTMYPRKYFDSIMIGNEVLFREDKTTQELIDIIKQTKKFLKNIGLIDLPVGTSEIGSLVNGALLRECDIFGANIHPFFGGGLVEDATNWTIDFLKYQINPMNEKYNTKIVISEVGWPYKGGSYQASVANSTNFQAFLNQWVCQLKKFPDLDWFYFEAFDEPWKEMFYEGDNKWETEFGIFDRNRQMKPGIQFPQCSE